LIAVDAAIQSHAFGSGRPVQISPGTQNSAAISICAVIARVGWRLCLTAALVLTLVLVISAVLAGIGEALKPGADERTVEKTVAAANFVAWLNLVLLLAGAILGCLGWLLCYMVPQKLNARPLVVASTCIEGSALLLLLICVVLKISGPGNYKAVLVLLLFAMIALFTGWIMFSVFVKTLSLFLRDEQTGEYAIKLVLQEIALVTALVILSLSMARALKENPGVAWGSAVSINVSFLAMQTKIMIGVLNVIGTLRQLILARF